MSVKTHNKFTQFECSCIETEWGQQIIYSPTKKGFLFDGEPVVHYGGGHTSFKIDGDLETSLPEGLKDSLKTVYDQKKTKTWFFPERIDNPSIGL